jgi:hypothetical protein
MGTNNLRLCYKIGYGDTYVPIGTGSIEVTATPISVTEALAIINKLAQRETTQKAYVVKGIVTGTVTYDSQYKQLNFNLKDTENNNKMVIFRANSYQGEEITDENLVKAGDEILIAGCLQNYNSYSKELVYGAILTINGSGPAPQDDAITVAEARTIALALANRAKTTETYRIKGYVVNNPDIQKKTDGSFYGNANFNMADEPEGTVTLYGYRVRGVNNESMNSSDYLQKGDLIVVEGLLQNYDGTPEVVNGYLLSLENISSTIHTVKADELRKSVRYNLAGQRVANSYRGIVVVNGHKIISK